MSLTLASLGKLPRFKVPVRRQVAGEENGHGPPCCLCGAANAMNYLLSGLYFRS